MSDTRPTMRTVTTPLAPDEVGTMGIPIGCGNLNRTPAEFEADFLLTQADPLFVYA